jgi:hypothetical protein
MKLPEGGKGGEGEDIFFLRVPLALDDGCSATLKDNHSWFYRLMLVLLCRLQYQPLILHTSSGAKYLVFCYWRLCKVQRDYTGH